MLWPWTTQRLRGPRVTAGTSRSRTLDAVFERRSSDNTGHLRIQPIEHLERQRSARAGRLAEGTLACPSCDSPVLPPRRISRPADELACPFCGQPGHVRDFLSLAMPTRATRVTVRVIAPELPARSA